MITPRQIDFAEIEGPVYTGRNRGERLRETLQLDALDQADDKILVLIPSAIYSISSSFFLGMFGPSVVRLGSKEAFYQKYDFRASEFLRGIVDTYVYRALQERSLFSK